MAIRIIEQDKIEQNVHSTMRITPFFLPPTIAPYAARAARFTQLATGHALADYLHLCAALCRAQESAVYHTPVSVPLRDSSYWQHCMAHDMPPFGVKAWPRDAVWRAILAHILTQLTNDSALPPSVKNTVLVLRALDEAALEAQASVLLGGNWQTLDRAIAPFIAAALQVYFNRLATALSVAEMGFTQDQHICPVCASAPSASCVRADSGGLRYLHCSLCETEWHFVRARCTQCATHAAMVYYSVEGEHEALRAECCDTCRAYLKVLDISKAPQADILADDIASLSLDLMLDEEGFERAGPNLLFFPG